MSPRRASGVLSLLFAASLAPVGRAQQPSPTPTPARQGQVVTRIDVDILELDVLVLDRKDKPVPDLKKEDFEVRIAGRLQPLEFFDPPALPRLPGAPPSEPELVSGTTTPLRADLRPPTHLLFFVDLEQLPLGAIHETGPALREAASRIPPPARVSLATNFGAPSVLVWEEEVLDRVTAAVDTLESAADQEAGSSSGRALTGSGPGPPQAGDSPLQYEQRQSLERILIDGLIQAMDSRNQGAVSDAWRQIANYVGGERIRVRDMLEGLRRVCEDFARLEGRKVLVFVSRGFERAPGFNFLNAVEVAVKAHAQPNAVDIRPNAPFPGLPGSGIGGVSATPLSAYDDLVRWIASSGITLHFLDPSRGTDFAGAEYSSAQRFRPLSDERKNLEETGANLASVTGGMTRFQPGDLKSALGTFLDATSGAYRLGVRMTDVDPRRSYKVTVSVKRPGARALARSAYQPKLPGAAAAADVAQADRQRLNAGVDQKRSGAGRQVLTPIRVALAFKGKSPAPPVEGKNLYKLDVLVPYDDLKFAPEEDSMVSSSRISVIADSAEGKGRESFSEDLFLTLSGKEYSEASGTQAVKTLTLQLAPGRWALTVSITDLLENRTGVSRTTVVAEP